MPARDSNPGDINTPSPIARKRTQRERLIAGMTAAADRDGYAAANVSEVIAHAGVSRPTFYDYFADRDDCFLATHRDIAERLLAHIASAVDDAPPEHALQAAIRRLLQRAQAEPAQARLLANEAMAAGPRALDERDRTIAQIERIVEDARARTPPDTPAPDLPARVAIGATQRLLSPCLRRHEPDLNPLADELTAWVETYNRPHRDHRWHTLAPGPKPPPSPYVSELPPGAPAPLPPRGAHSPAELARNQRERIMFATAENAARKGYTATTIADITTTARVHRRVFYHHFRDKQDAFLAVHELGFQQAMAVTAGAFFSATAWPERVWQAILAITQFDATHPTIAHVVFVESHAVGPPAVQRVEDSQNAFTIFLHEGNQHAAHPRSPSVMQAIIAAILEIGYHQARHGKTRELPRLAHHAAYLSLAPFLGPDAADERIPASFRPIP